MPERVSFYIDGYNLYCGIRSKFGKKWLWLDLEGVAKSLLRADQVLERIHFCTAKTRGNQDSWRRQDAYWQALSSIPRLTIHQGFHQQNRKWCNGCRQYVQRCEEKQTDSRIASLMVADAMADRTDLLILIGGDSDHVPPVQTVQQEAPHKELVVCWPPDRRSNALGKAVGREFYLSKRLLRQNQFPDTVSLVGGGSVSRPPEWRPATSK